MCPRSRGYLLFSYKTCSSFLEPADKLVELGLWLVGILHSQYPDPARWVPVEHIVDGTVVTEDTFVSRLRWPPMNLCRSRRLHSGVALRTGCNTVVPRTADVGTAAVHRALLSEWGPVREKASRSCN